MTKKITGRLFSFIFIAIFFIKMIISVAPVIADHFDSGCIRSVMLQLEIENHSADESSEQIKKLLSKEEWIETGSCFNISLPFKHLVSARYIILDDTHVQTFYPAVLTPPPSI
jgi:hypothetical protein